MAFRTQFSHSIFPFRYALSLLFGERPVILRFFMVRPHWYIDYLGRLNTRFKSSMSVWDIPSGSNPIDLAIRYI